MDDVLFKDSKKDVVITRNGARVNIPIDELIARERRNLGTILDNVEDDVSIDFFGQTPESKELVEIVENFASEMYRRGFTVDTVLLSEGKFPVDCIVTTTSFIKFINKNKYDSTIGSFEKELIIKRIQKALNENNS